MEENQRSSVEASSARKKKVNQEVQMRNSESPRKKNNRNNRRGTFSSVDSSSSFGRLKNFTGNNNDKRQGTKMLDVIDEDFKGEKKSILEHPAQRSCNRNTCENYISKNERKLKTITDSSIKDAVQNVIKNTRDSSFRTLELNQPSFNRFEVGSEEKLDKSFFTDSDEQNTPMIYFTHSECENDFLSPAKVVSPISVKESKVASYSRDLNESNALLNNRSRTTTKINDNLANPMEQFEPTKIHEVNENKENALTTHFNQPRYNDHYLLPPANTKFQSDSTSASENNFSFPTKTKTLSNLKNVSCKCNSSSLENANRISESRPTQGQNYQLKIMKSNDNLSSSVEQFINKYNMKRVKKSEKMAKVNKSSKRSKTQKRVKADNRKMTGNVNIYICSETNESVNENKKKAQQQQQQQQQRSQETTSASATETEISSTYSSGGVCDSSNTSLRKLISNLLRKQKKSQITTLKKLCNKSENTSKHGVDKSQQENNEVIYFRETSNLPLNLNYDENVDHALGPKDKSIESKYEVNLKLKDTKSTSTSRDIYYSPVMDSSGSESADISGIFASPKTKFTTFNNDREDESFVRSDHSYTIQDCRCSETDEFGDYETYSSEKDDNMNLDFEMSQMSCSIQNCPYLKDDFNQYEDYSDCKCDKRDRNFERSERPCTIQDCPYLKVDPTEYNGYNNDKNYEGNYLGTSEQFCTIKNCPYVNVASDEYITSNDEFDYVDTENSTDYSQRIENSKQIYTDNVRERPAFKEDRETMKYNWKRQDSFEKETEHTYKNTGTSQRENRYQQYDKCSSILEVDEEYSTDIGRRSFHKSKVSSETFFVEKDLEVCKYEKESKNNKISKDHVVPAERETELRNSVFEKSVSSLSINHSPLPIVNQQESLQNNVVESETARSFTPVLPLPIIDNLQLSKNDLSTIVSQSVPSLSTVKPDISQQSTMLFLTEKRVSADSKSLILPSQEEGKEECSVLPRSTVETEHIIENQTEETADSTNANGQSISKSNKNDSSDDTNVKKEKLARVCVKGWNEISKVQNVNVTKDCIKKRQSKWPFAGKQTPKHTKCHPACTNLNRSLTKIKDAFCAKERTRNFGPNATNITGPSLVQKSVLRNEKHGDSNNKLRQRDIHSSIQRKGINSKLKNSITSRRSLLEPAGNIIKNTPGNQEEPDSKNIENSRDMKESAELKDRKDLEIPTDSKLSNSYNLEKSEKSAESKDLKDLGIPMDSKLSNSYSFEKSIQSAESNNLKDPEIPTDPKLSNSYNLEKSEKSAESEDLKDLEIPIDSKLPNSYSFEKSKKSTDSKDLKDLEIPTDPKLSNSYNLEKSEKSAESKDLKDLEIPMDSKLPNSYSFEKSKKSAESNNLKDIEIPTDSKLSNSYNLEKSEKSAESEDLKDLEIPMDSKLSNSYSFEKSKKSAESNNLKDIEISTDSKLSNSDNLEKSTKSIDSLDLQDLKVSTDSKLSNSRDHEKSMKSTETMDLQNLIKVPMDSKLSNSYSFEKSKKSVESNNLKDIEIQTDSKLSNSDNLEKSMKSIDSLVLQDQKVSTDSKLSNSRDLEKSMKSTETMDLQDLKVPMDSKLSNSYSFEKSKKSAESNNLKDIEIQTDLKLSNSDNLEKSVKSAESMDLQDQKNPMDSKLSNSYSFEKSEELAESNNLRDLKVPTDSKLSNSHNLEKSKKSAESKDLKGLAIPTDSKLSNSHNLKKIKKPTGSKDLKDLEIPMDSKLPNSYKSEKSKKSAESNNLRDLKLPTDSKLSYSHNLEKSKTSTESKDLKGLAIPTDSNIFNSHNREKSKKSAESNDSKDFKVVAHSKNLNELDINTSAGTNSDKCTNTYLRHQNRNELQKVCYCAMSKKEERRNVERNYVSTNTPSRNTNGYVQSKKLQTNEITMKLPKVYRHNCYKEMNENNRNDINNILEPCDGCCHCHHENNRRETYVPEDFLLNIASSQPENEDEFNANNETWKSMICLYCDNPQDRCICTYRAPIEERSYCGLSVDICNCQERKPISNNYDATMCKCNESPVRGTEIGNRIIRAASWKPRRSIRRYFPRDVGSLGVNSKENCRYYNNSRPYGSSELPYQRLSIFSDVMNELQQKMCESACCGRCRNIPCCCHLARKERERRFSPTNERNNSEGSPERRISRYKYPSNNFGSNQNPWRFEQRKHSPPRVCDKCRTTPCRCRRSRSTQRKPRAKCFYCKCSPCRCITTRRMSRSRSCKCRDSLQR